MHTRRHLGTYMDSEKADQFERIAKEDGFDSVSSIIRKLAYDYMSRKLTTTENEVQN